EVTNEETPTPLPTNTPAPVKKSEISIEIQNGTGITGEAAYLQEKLKVLGYSDIKVGNASSTDNTETTVTFSKTTPQTVQDEIKKELEKIYKTVNVKTSSTQTVDILIVTGLRGTQTSKPSTTATPKASGTATPKPSATASSSATPTASPQ
ncbi:MAG: LytR C-terminal domain-containing protein, partial [Candidatus Woesebacteria bacterium]|nr:LytR C-terminal domain-containing protein [Candidatus Woesebacteria bacterium]